jgi:hypothetical protein
VSNSICVTDSATGIFNGGAVIFGCGSSQFAAIRCDFRNGAGYGVGDFVFFNRTNTAVEGLTEVMRFTAAGGVAMATLPSANPGAGTKQIYYDPADGNRLKYAP